MKQFLSFFQVEGGVPSFYKIKKIAKTKKKVECAFEFFSVGQTDGGQSFFRSESKKKLVITGFLLWSSLKQVIEEHRVQCIKS